MDILVKNKAFLEINSHPTYNFSVLKNEESDRLKMLEAKLNEEKIKNMNRTPKKKKLF